VKTGAFLFDLTFKIPSRSSPDRMAVIALPDEGAGADPDLFAHHRIIAATTRARRSADSPDQDALVIFALENTSSRHKSLTVITLQLRPDLNGFAQLVKRVASDTAAFVH
jgi:hypothetical protein